MKGEQFAHSDDFQKMYYVNHDKKMYTFVEKDNNPEIHHFLMHVYAISWEVLSKYISDYEFKKSIDEIGKY